MNYYYILPNTPAGQTVLLTDQIESVYSVDMSSYPNDSLVLAMDSYDYHDELFSLHPFHFVAKNFKEILEREKMFEFEFQKVDIFIPGMNLIDTVPDHGFTKDSFWRISNDKTNIHLMNNMTRTIVSEVFLQYLISKNVFKYSISGSHIGKELEYVNNVFRIRGTVEEYFEEYYKIDADIVRNKQKKLIEISKRSKFS